MGKIDRYITTTYTIKREPVHNSWSILYSGAILEMLDTYKKYGHSNVYVYVIKNIAAVSKHNWTEATVIYDSWMNYIHIFIRRSIYQTLHSITCIDLLKTKIIYVHQYDAYKVLSRIPTKSIHLSLLEVLLSILQVQLCFHKWIRNIWFWLLLCCVFHVNEDEWNQPKVFLQYRVNNIDSKAAVAITIANLDTRAKVNRNCHQIC